MKYERYNKNIQSKEIMLEKINKETEEKRSIKQFKIKNK